LINVFEEDRQRQAFFDYFKARAKYAGTEWEFLLDIDAVIYRRDRDEAKAMVDRILSKATADRPAASAAPINSPGSWDFFLSHAGHQASGDPSKVLCLLLQQAGKTVWYDIEMVEKSTAAMEEGIEHSANVLVFLSGM
jgi:hypothetical protein